METELNTTTGADSLDRLVRLCVANRTPEELALGWLRYEALRRVSPRIFAEMNRRNLAGEFFDDIVTEALLSWKSPEPKIGVSHERSESAKRTCSQL